MRSLIKSVFKYIIFFAFTIFMCFIIYEKTPLKPTNISSVNLNGIDNLMIVAHPDDETLWGGSHLIDDNYLVVCITCGTSRTRVEEFKKALSISKDAYIMLSYPDKTKNKRDDWSLVYSSIEKDLEKIMKLKKWNIIVTHNIDGEYGHIHHKMTHNIVKSIYDKKEFSGDLFFFGKYYTKKNIDLYKDKLIKIKSKNKEIKVNKMIEVYKSQSFIKSYFNQMFEYESWQKYK